MKTEQKNILNLIALISTLIFNALGAFGKINKLSQKDVSDMFSSPITPAPFTFSIWSLIYILLLLAIIDLIRKSHKPAVKRFTKTFTPLFIFSSLCNILWIISFSYVQLELSTIIIILFLFTLLKIMNLLKEENGLHPILNLSFELYAGWLSIASLVNIAATLEKNKFSGFGLSETTWMITTLAFVLVFTFYIQKYMNSQVYPLPIAWAFFGIYKNSSNHNHNVQWMLIAGIAYLIILAMKSIYLESNKNE